MNKYAKLRVSRNDFKVSSSTFADKSVVRVTKTQKFLSEVS
jgi:hypothetical protein